MARRLFFSFHYERDIWRVQQVRNSWVTHADREQAGYWDAGLWEDAKKKGDDAIKRMINEGLSGSSVTAVLIGAETASREYVTYEIVESFKAGKGLLGIYINGIKDRNGQTDVRGANPFANVYYTQDSRKITLDTDPRIKLYDWVANDGYNNLAKWVEAAARAFGR